MELFQDPFEVWSFSFQTRRIFPEFQDLYKPFFSHIPSKQSQYKISFAFIWVFILISCTHWMKHVLRCCLIPLNGAMNLAILWKKVFSLWKTGSNYFRVIISWQILEEEQKHWKKVILGPIFQISRTFQLLYVGGAIPRPIRGLEFFISQCSAICTVFGVGPFAQTLSVKCFVGSDVNV